MNTIKIILEVLCVAVVIMFLYAWGYVKQQRQSVDLLRQLERKAKRKVITALRKKGTMTKKDIEREIANLRVSLFFSRNKAVVKDSKAMSKTIIQDLIDSGIVDVDNETIKFKFLKKVKL